MIPNKLSHIIKTRHGDFWRVSECQSQSFVNYNCSKFLIILINLMIATSDHCLWELICLLLEEEGAVMHRIIQFHKICLMPVWAKMKVHNLSQGWSYIASKKMMIAPKMYLLSKWFTFCDKMKGIIFIWCLGPKSNYSVTVFCQEVEGLPKCSLVGNLPVNLKLKAKILRIFPKRVSKNLPYIIVLLCTALLNFCILNIYHTDWISKMYKLFVQIVIQIPT